MSDQIELDLDGYGHIPSPQAITAGQVLSYNGTSGQWTAAPANTPMPVAKAIPMPSNGNVVSVPVSGNLSGTYGAPTVQRITSMFPVGWITTGIGLGVTKPTIKSENKSGCTCKNCKELFPYAEPNQEDGSMICWGCRNFC